MPDTKIDFLTVGAIAVVTYFLSAFIHEALGHGFAALLLGGRVKQIASDFVDYDGSRLSIWANRAIAAAGCATNLLAGFALLFWLRRGRVQDANNRYFFWLVGHINLFQGFGYMLALSFASFGDWNDFVQGFESKLVWKIGLTLFGLAGSLSTFFHASRTLDPFAGANNSTRRRRAFALTLTPYLVGGLVNSLAAAAGPGGMLLVLLSAMMATFGGTYPLVWVPIAVGAPRASSPAIPLTPTRSKLWLALGVIGLAIYLLIFGPGLIR